MTGRSTVFALASGAGRAGVAVVRVSGRMAGRALESLTGRAVPPARNAVLRRLRTPAGEPIDSALVLWFPAPASFTGEDVAEFQVHGGRAVLALLFDSLSALPDLRPAEPGEFSRRAFENGLLDLTEAEGLADLVSAETEAQRRQALRQMDGQLGRLYDSWRADLIAAMAEQEAAVDFPDEDLPPDLLARVGRRVDALRTAIRAHLEDRRAGERLREGLSVVILGQPNVGKSSLLNALAGRDAAIVSSRPGTTRDVVEVQLDLGGLPVTVADTAGLRSAAEEIETEGIRRALDRANRADLKLIVVEAARTPYVPSDLAALLDDRALIVANKADLASDAARFFQHRPIVPVSAATGWGINALLAEIQAFFERDLAPVGSLGITRARHRQALEDAEAALIRFSAAADPELAAEDLRLAARALGRITGRVDVEDILDILFGAFCIGK